MRFKERLNDAFDSLGVARPDWGSGLWQHVLHIYGLRKDYVHPGLPQERLFAPVVEAEQVIEVLRGAIKDVYARTGGAPAAEWPDDDADPVDPRKDDVAHATVIRSGASRESAVRICYALLGKEYESEVAPPEVDHVALMEDLLRAIRVPISAVRPYRGETLVEEIVVKMRGSS
jgi:hypothetical protein